MSNAFSMPNENHKPDPAIDCTEALAGLGPAHAPSTLGHAAKHGPGTHGAERRSRRRAVISAPVRVRALDVTGNGPDEATTSLDVSRNGLLISVKSNLFFRGMEVAVTFPYTRAKGAIQAEQHGRVVRVTELPGLYYTVAIALNAGAGEDLVDARGKVLERAPVRSWSQPEKHSKKPLVLAVDADPAVRMTLKTNLEGEGYDVIAVSSSDEAHDVLNLLTPALVIAEIEGAALPGYELCAHIKGTPRLQPIPVVLLTSSAYPTDYANAHSLGAVVCMAKPFRQERLGHVVRLLAPTQQAKEQTAAFKPNPMRPASTAACEAKKDKPKSKGFRFRSPW